MLFALWQRLRSSPKQPADQEGRTGAAEKTRRTVRRQSCEFVFETFRNLNVSVLPSFQFYNLLLVALFLRTMLFPLLIYSYYHEEVTRTLEIMADSLPLVAFGATWAWLVNFFVQLVVTASGSYSPTTTDTTNASEDDKGMSLTTALQGTAYGVYSCLLVSYFLYHEAAAVLLYALLCCVFAALMGTWVFVCPKLIVLLQPLEDFRKLLAVRLWISCFGVFVVLLGETIALARQVLLVFSFSERPLWILYGGLELLPAVTLLVMMHTHGSSSSTDSSNDAVANGTQSASLPQYTKSSAGGSNIRRTHSAGGVTATRVTTTTPGETTRLLHKSA
jgi:hypothetical protein